MRRDSDEARAMLETLANRRAELDRSLLAVSSRAGLQPSAIHYYEHHERWPSLPSFIEWAKALGYEVRLEKAGSSG